MTRLIFAVLLAITPSFCGTAAAPDLAATPQILTGSLQVLTEPEPWVAPVDESMTTVEASLIDTPPEIVVGNTMLFGHGSFAPSAIFAAVAMLALASVAGAFVAGVRV